MASEVLVIPEEYLAEVIEVIRGGLKHSRGLSGNTWKHLARWCDEMEDYLKEGSEEEIDGSAA